MVPIVHACTTIYNPWDFRWLENEDGAAPGMEQPAAPCITINESLPTATDEQPTAVAPQKSPAPTEIPHAAVDDDIKVKQQWSGASGNNPLQPTVELPTCLDDNAVAMPSPISNATTGLHLPSLLGDTKILQQPQTAPQLPTCLLDHDEDPLHLPPHIDATLFPANPPCQSTPPQSTPPPADLADMLFPVSTTLTPPWGDLLGVQPLFSFADV